MRDLPTLHLNKIKIKVMEQFLVRKDIKKYTMQLQCISYPVNQEEISLYMYSVSSAKNAKITEEM